MPGPLTYAAAAAGSARRAPTLPAALGRLALAQALGLVAACGDKKAPDTTARISGTVPSDKAIGVSTTAPIIKVIFARQFDPATITAQSFLLSSASGPVAGTVDATASEATFTPAGKLAALALHTATLTTAIKDAKGEALPAAVTWTFTTGNPADLTPPTVLNQDPFPGATLVPLGKVIVANISKRLDPATVTSAAVTLRLGGASGTLVPAVVGLDAAGTKISLAPLSPLAGSSQFTVNISAGVTDTLGLALDHATAWSFTTAPPPDDTPPTVLQFAPADLAAGVSTTAHVEVVFSEPMAAATLTPANLKLKQGASLVSGAVTLAHGRVALFKPDAPLSPNKVYAVSVTTAVKDLAGNALVKQLDFGFTTGGGADTAAPSITAQNPADGEASVAINRPVIVVFSEPLAPATVDPASFALTSGGTAIAGSFVFDGNTVVFVPAQPLPSSATLTVTLGASLTDLSGNALGAAKSWSFGTGTDPDAVAPTVLSTVPAAAATGVGVHSQLSATFSEFVLPSTVNAATFTVRDSTGAAVPGAVAVLGALATFAPQAALVYGATYAVKLTTGIADAAGNRLAAETSFGFTAQPVPAARLNEIAAAVSSASSGAAGDTNGDGVRDGAQDEFVEVLNTDTVDADLSGWVIATSSTTTTSTPHDQFTFPANTVLQPGARAVVFGGGAPAGDFGGALVFSASGLSLTDGGAVVALRAAPGIFADGPLAYPAAPSSGASLVRSPEGTGGFVDHSTVSGSAGVLWSPGVAATDARPKVNKLKSAPAEGAAGFDPRQAVTVQLNMAIFAQSIAGNVKLFASDCATASPEVAGAATVATGSLTAIKFTPGAQLAEAARHCVKVIGGAAGVQSDARTGGNPVGARLAADVAWEFTTGTIAYNLLTAAMTGPATLALGFSAPPDPATGQATASYCINTTGACTAPGSPAVTAAVVGGNGVTLTLASAPASGGAFRVFAAGVTRAGDNAALTTKDLAFTGYVPPPFNLVSVASTGESEVTVTLSDPPAAGLAASNFCIAAAAATDCTTSALPITAAANATNPSAVVLITGVQVKALGYKLFATGVTRASDGVPLLATSGALKGFLLANGSFEKDQQPAASPATAAPTGWTMVSSVASGNLLHAVQSDGQNGVPPAVHGLNVARFDTLTNSGSSYREAQSDCFPLDAARPINVRYQVRIPSGQVPAGTKAAVKVTYYKDAACATLSTVRPGGSDTQSGASNQVAGVWEPRKFTPAQNPPSDGVAARVSVRAGYVSGSSCGGGVIGNCVNDALYFDDVAVSQ